MFRLNFSHGSHEDHKQRLHAVRAIEQERNKALAELETLKKEIEENTKAVAQVEDEARRAGVPAGWLRP